MKTIKHILPAMIITGIITATLLLLYRGIYNYAKDKCWQELSDTAEQLASGIASEFEDDVAKLHIMEAILLRNNLEDKDCLDALYLDTVLPTTMFSRIDIWYPDNTVVSSGNKRKVNPNIVFEEMAAAGEQMSRRTTDSVTGNESVYYILPIIKEDDTIAMLIGVIDLKEIADRFHPKIYNGQGEICVIDSIDANFIIDSWHDELTSVYELGNRKQIKGYEDVNFPLEIKNRETGVVVFESKTTGEPLYMYYTPIDGFDWELALFAQEGTIFEYLIHLRKWVIIVGTLVTVLTVIYFGWNVNTVRLLNRKVTELEENKELLKRISYTDALTAVNNRTKYNEVWRDIKEKSLENMGVAYFDLNGLKQINDTKSHDEGDKYICKAADIISEMFEEDCYRIGGDEFVVLSAGIEKELFANKISSIKKQMQENKIDISVGHCWKASCSNVKIMRKEAEEQMYKEKEAYYRIHDRRNKKDSTVSV